MIFAHLASAYFAADVLEPDLLLDRHLVDALEGAQAGQRGLVLLLLLLLLLLLPSIGLLLLLLPAAVAAAAAVWLLGDDVRHGDVLGHDFPNLILIFAKFDDGFPFFVLFF